MRFVKSVKGVEIAVDAIESVGPSRKVTSKTPETRTVTTKSGAKHEVLAEDMRRLKDELRHNEVSAIVPAHGFWLCEPTDGAVRKRPLVAWAVWSSHEDGVHEAYPVAANVAYDSGVECPDGRVIFGDKVYRDADAMREARDGISAELAGIAMRGESDR